MLFRSIIDALVQLVIFAIIPFLHWALKIKNQESFYQWIGLKKPAFQPKSKSIILSALSFAILLLPGVLLLFVIDDKTMIANAQFATKGWQSIGGILIYSIIQTGLSEELLFRGFFLKIFSSRWGLGIGNFIQALLFGLLHGAILFASLNFFLVITIIVFSALAGWLMGYVNNNLGNGSILPSWFIHSFMNIISSLLLAFNFL
ncbi:MAG: CPBP family intramembrane metalloprotease [Tetragenococcus sp.]|nr:CPBP family intramembrane metalloprotease [Tetragenococcus sp.]